MRIAILISKTALCISYSQQLALEFTFTIHKSLSGNSKVTCGISCFCFFGNNISSLCSGL